jgi:hypothetical protein
LERVKIDIFLMPESVKLPRLACSKSDSASFEALTISTSHLDIRGKQLILAS